MASTDTRSGFRLPWSSDRSHDDAPATPEAAEAAEAPEALDAPTAEGESMDESTASGAASGRPAWPEADVNARPRATQGEPRSHEIESPARPIAEEPPMANPYSAPPASTAPPRKPSKLMADLSAAIRSTAETARDQALAQTDADSRQVVEAIRQNGTEGAAALRQRSEDDIAGIRDWSKAEIARIREETDQKINDRKARLEDELADHATSVDHRVEDVEAEVARYQAQMEAYLERLRTEEDPARLATLAESMPESPTFEAWTDQPVADAADAEAETEAVAPEIGEVETETETEAEAAVPADAAAAMVAEPVVDDVPSAEAAEPATSEAERTGNEATAETSDRVWSGVSWGDTEGDWSPPGAKAGDPEEGDDVPRWAAGETPDGFPAPAEGGDPVDRGAIMAALEAAAEAVVAAESAADSADQAEAAADVAETAAEIVRGRRDSDDPAGLDPEAEAALNARMEAGGFETESFANRLASLLPGHAGDADGEPVTTQVIVSGLISVASIASFKRHLGRVAGVTAVAVASGPDGEFVFNVTHRPDVAFRDVIPTMPGFAARVTTASDGVVHVAARDPESEG